MTVKKSSPSTTQKFLYESGGSWGYDMLSSSTCQSFKKKSGIPPGTLPGTGGFPIIRCPSLSVAIGEVQRMAVACGGYV